ncbi:SDR family oxidoreductase [Bacillus sp. FJAT-44742]|uniref:SDR family oxidoreductase n=1 Tax=Bacillus sp. FJAT-44742 TaxID=2014005 RepID=UPI000C23EA76|nr:SDR family oxidoreductase [Bacillus sp. FJAT-44742]
MRHAIITAGSKGLGRKVTETFLNKGYAVTVSYRSDIRAVQALKEQYHDKLGQIHIVQGDVTKKEDLARIVSEGVNRFGRIDVLVNNAGPYVFERKKLMDYKPEEWHEMVDGNLTSMFYLFQHVVPHMREQKYGRIITYGFQGAGDAPGWLYRSAYAASKVGLVSLMKSVALEEAENGITVNMVCPGVITEENKEASIQEAKGKTDNITPVGRPGTGGDIARTIAFLCEEDSDMITGSVIEVTGGVDVLHKYRGKAEE